MENGKQTKLISQPLKSNEFLLHRVALMIHDFRDTVSQSQGSHQEVNGSTALNLRLLTKAGYHVIGVPYYEFSISDKLLKRVQYLEKIIKALNSN